MSTGDSLNSNTNQNSILTTIGSIPVNEEMTENFINNDFDSTLDDTEMTNFSSEMDIQSQSLSLSLNQNQEFTEVVDLDFTLQLQQLFNDSDGNEVTSIKINKKFEKFKIGNSLIRLSKKQYPYLEQVINKSIEDDNPPVIVNNLFQSIFGESIKVTKQNAWEKGSKEVIACLDKLELLIVSFKDFSSKKILTKITNRIIIKFMSDILYQAMIEKKKIKIDANGSIEIQ